MSPNLVEYSASYLEPLLRLWRAFEFGVGITDPHPLSEQREHFVSLVLPSNRVTLAVLQSQLVGFVAASEESVSQLPRSESACIVKVFGSALLALAKARSSGTLWLYTFARNARACQFYEKHGFVAIERGFEPHWQLEDVKYRWSAEGDVRTIRLQR